MRYEWFHGPDEALEAVGLEGDRRRAVWLPPLRVAGRHDRERDDAPRLATPTSTTRSRSSRSQASAWRTDIEEAKRDWEAKQQDPGVPGAMEAPEDEYGEPQAAQSEHGEAADRAGQ